MCGITIIVTSSDIPNKELDCIDKLKELIDRRGPDCQGSYEGDVPGQAWHFIAYGSTLWTQGRSPTFQPLKTDRGNFLLWNGDAYNDEVTSLEISDSCTVLHKIEEENELLKILPQIVGPYAFIYYDPEARSLWFGRDPIGRCSLVVHSNNGRIVISSVAPRNLDCEEVPSQGVFQVIFRQNSYETILHPWNDILKDRLSESILKPKVSKPIQHEILNRRRNPEWANTHPDERDVYLQHKNSSVRLEPLEALKEFSKHEKIADALTPLMKILQDSVKLRVAVRPKFCQNCSAVDDSSATCEHTKVAILFSGGLDSTILAVLADQVLEASEPIDLYNVAFDKLTSKASNAPDRITGYGALKELQGLAPGRRWNFVEITVKEQELSERVDYIANLIHPLNSVLDESLGCALWFAARGEGLLASNHYKSPARIVLVGMGADELFGGYSRHAKIFKETGSWIELGDMLLKEVQNIGSRNMGRDNRVILDHGRMMRAPFLDEAFVSYINNLPPWLRCCPSSELPRGVGDKTLLRLAAFAVGLRETAVQPKRALQFGSRIANSKQKGHQVSTKLTGNDSTTNYLRL